MRNKTTVIVNGDQKYKIKRKIFISVVLLIVLVLMLQVTISVKLMNKRLDEERNSIYKLNSKTVFSIDKIVLYSSASAIENAEKRAVWNIDPYQFTDIAIYINNRKDEYFNYENTIKEMYIDNVKFSGPEIGFPNLYDKDINDFGKSLYTTTEAKLTNEDTSEEKSLKTRIFEKTDENKISDKLTFEVLNDGELDYSKPETYTDCSHPITLEYVNNIKENHIISDINSDITYNGTLLRKSGVILSEIKTSLSFRITLINNYDQEFIANVYLEIPFEDTITGETIYDGSFTKKIEGKNTFKFLRIK